MPARPPRYLTTSWFDHPYAPQVFDHPYARSTPPQVFDYQLGVASGATVQLDLICPVSSPGVTVEWSLQPSDQQVDDPAWDGAQPMAEASLTRAMVVTCSPCPAGWACNKHLGPALLPSPPPNDGSAGGAGPAAARTEAWWAAMASGRAATP